jgi:hypothetical protein
MNLTTIKMESSHNEYSQVKKIYKSISIQMMILPLCEGVLAIQSLAFFLLYSKHFKISLLNYSIIETVMTMLACLSPVMGHLSDKFSLFGTKKKSYLVLCSLIGTAGYIVCALSGILKLGVIPVFVLEVIIHLSNSFRHLLVDSLCVVLHNIHKCFFAPTDHNSSTSSVAKLFGNRIIGKIFITVLIGISYDIVKEKSSLISLLRICRLRYDHRNLRAVFDRAKIFA